MSQSVNCRYGRWLPCVCENTENCEQRWANSAFSADEQNTRTIWGQPLSEHSHQQHTPNLVCFFKLCSCLLCERQGRNEKPGIQVTWHDQRKSLLGYTSKGDDEKVLLELLTVCKINHNWFFLHMHLPENRNILKYLRWFCFSTEMLTKSCTWGYPALSWDWKGRRVSGGAGEKEKKKKRSPGYAIDICFDCIRIKW